MIRECCKERLNHSLHKAISNSPPDLGMISADDVRESDISDNPIVDFVRASSSLDESICSYVDFEASDGGGEKK